MRILALDTTTASASLALVVDEGKGAEIRGERVARVRARHGETLLPHVEALLAASGLTLGELSLLAVGIGPGSFTGTRIGLATAKGLALAASLPIVGVGSLVAHAYDALGAWPRGVAGALIDASRGAAYGALYRFGADGTYDELVAPFEGDPEEVRRDLLARAGTDVPLGGDLGGSAEGLGVALARSPRASVLAVLGAARLQAEGPDSLAALEPHYVRGADAKLPGA